MDNRRALIIGCGYLGIRIGRLLTDRGFRVLGTTRRETRIEQLRAAGIDGELFDLADAATSPLLRRGFDVVIYSVAPGRSEENSAIVYRDGLRACLDVLGEAPPTRFVLLSSTGVYSQDDGSWIDEESPALPTGNRQQRLVDGESLLLEAFRATGFPGVVVRLGGLYGPDRSPVAWCREPAWRTRLARGNREAYMNWVHADDAAAAAVLAAESGRPGEIYLIVDDEPVRREDFYRFACELAGSAPLELPSDPGHTAKRCSNRKAREELGFVPKHRSYREGLASL